MRYTSDRHEEEVYFPIPIHSHPHHHHPHHHNHHHIPSGSNNPSKLRHSQSGAKKRSAIEAAVVPVIAAVDPSTYHYNYLVNSSPSNSSSPRGGPSAQPQQPHHLRRTSSTSAGSTAKRSSSAAAAGGASNRNKMASKVEYVHSDQLMAATYVKNSKAIGFLWGIFSVCYAIITLVVFIQPQWIGARSPASSGYFGLWRHCAVASVMTETSTTSEFICRGRLDDFSSIINPAFRVATVFVGIAALVAILSVFGLILFICAPARQAYFIISMMQTLAAICTGVGLVVFPAGFDAAEVKLTCGPQADGFYLGSCTIRWAYVLAIIGLLDGAVLAVLGFVLGSKQIKLSDEFSGSTRKIHSISGLNGYPPPPRGGYFYGTDSGPTPSVTYSYASTKRSTMGAGMGGLQPIVLLPPDAESEYRSKASLYRAEYATPKQNIQL